MANQLHIATNDPQLDELVRWRPASEKPDADVTVLVYAPDLDEPVWPGFYDDDMERWIVDALETEVTFWAPMPGGPTF